MSNPNFELSYTESCLEELENYLLSKELFWQVTTPPHMMQFPPLTLGNLLLSLGSLKGYRDSGLLTPEQEEKLADLESQIDALHHKWTVAWENNVGHEYQSRLRQWSNFLNEIKFSHDGHQAYYATEVRNRVLLELLNESVPQNAHAELSNLDAVLRAKLQDAEFIWEPKIQSAFPKDHYWFLYGGLSNHS